jgi:hypothetical protein
MTINSTLPISKVAIKNLCQQNTITQLNNILLIEMTNYL